MTNDGETDLRRTVLGIVTVALGVVLVYGALNVKCDRDGSSETWRCGTLGDTFQQTIERSPEEPSDLTKGLMFVWHLGIGGGVVGGLIGLFVKMGK